MSHTRRPLISAIPVAVLAAFALTIPAPASAVAVGDVPAVTADNGARVTAQRSVDDRILDVTIDSPALGTTVTTRLLLPAGWSPRSRRAYPVLYLLHGCCEPQSYAAWTAYTDMESAVAELDVMVVMPPGGYAGWYSDWWNHGNGGMPGWETFHLTELRQLLERGYHAGQRRAIAGLSMGGFGALSYAARHPGMFVAAASYSGAVHSQYDPPTGSTIVQTTLLLGGHDPLALWGDPVLQRDIWAAHNPYHLAPLLDMPLYLACGNGQPGPLDPPGTGQDVVEQQLEGENRALVRRLRELGADATVNLYGPGTHTWPYWEREFARSLPTLMQPLRVRLPAAA
ncbi:MAG: alpha/beta hydrolase [Micromonosporaceae bacterium]